MHPFDKLYVHGDFRFSSTSSSGFLVIFTLIFSALVVVIIEAVVAVAVVALVMVVLVALI